MKFPIALIGSKIRTESKIYSLVFLGLFIATLFLPAGNYAQQGDENANLRNLQLVEKYGVSTDFLRNYQGAAGPGYAVLQYFFLPFTGGKIQYLRVINLLFLLALIVILTSYLHTYDSAIVIMSIPMTYLCAPFAMGMMPCLVFLLSAYIFLMRGLPNENPGLLFLSGMILSIAILLRLNVIFLLPLWILSPILIKKKNRLLGLWIMLGATPLIAWLFLAWGGLVPPGVRADLGGEVKLLGQYSLSLVFITSAIVAGIHFAIRPGWFQMLRTTNRVLWAVSACLVFVINYFFNGVFYLPAQVIISRMGFSQEMHFLLGNMIGSICVMIALAYFFLLMKKLKNVFLQPDFFAYLTVMIIMVSTGIASHAVSSRYAYLSFPFLAIISNDAPDKKIGPYFRMILMLFGIVVFFYFRNYIPYDYIRF